MARVLPIAGPHEPRKLRIGDLARFTNKSTRAVRLYEEMNLLGAVERTESGQRIYDEDALLRVCWIDKLQSLGFTLGQIRDFLKQWNGSRFAPEAMATVRAVFAEKLEETQLQIRELESLSAELSDSLTYLETCGTCSPSTLLNACSGCEQDHRSDDTPPLVAGFQVGQRLGDPREDQQ